MENDNQKEGKSGYSFLKTREAKNFFAEADYHLKNGTHIQREFPKPEGIYRFVDTYCAELKEYYDELFQVVLTYHGEDWNKYYFLDFNEGTRGNISLNNREYFSVQNTIIGLLFLNIYKIDAHIEINSVTDFKRVLREEYQEHNQDLSRLLADVSGDKETDYTNRKVDAAIDNAFKSFAKLGWIYFIQQEEMRIMPSFERLRRMYENQIRDIQDIFKSTSEADELSENT